LGGFGFPDRNILFQAIEKVSYKGESFGAVRSENADPNRNLADGNMAEAMEKINGSAGMGEGKLPKDVADKCFGHGMVGFVKEGGDGLVLLLISNDPRKSYHSTRSGIGNIG